MEGCSLLLVGWDEDQAMSRSNVRCTRSQIYPEITRQIILRIRQDILHLQYFALAQAIRTSEIHKYKKMR